MVPMEDIEARHRKEKKELQAQLTALKKAAKNDKSKKKELAAEVVRLETDLEHRHEQELSENQSKVDLGPASEVADSEIAIITQKVSKAQKRREKKSQLERERAEQIKAQEKENVSGPRNVELQSITAKLKELSLRIHSVPSDGDCLYNAVSHQLHITGRTVLTVEQLRVCAAKHIQKNKDDFIPFMSNPDTFQMLTDIEFEDYCEKLSTTKVWGGQLEIQALSNILKSPIKVIQATGPLSIDQGTEYESPPLILTYHRHMYKLGEHYNSTEPIPVEESES